MVHATSKRIGKVSTPVCDLDAGSRMFVPLIVKTLQHINHVKCSAELEPDAARYADMGKSHDSVQRDLGSVPTVADHRHDLPEPLIGA